jgi:uncharacterized membrane protein
MSEEDLKKYRQALRDFNDVNRAIRNQARQDWSVVHGACGTDGICNTTIKHRKFLRFGSDN